MNTGLTGLKQLVLGGARSGKSAYAERLAAETGLEVVYLATAQAVDARVDADMASRIENHQARRPEHWLLHEEPVYLAQTLQQLASDKRCLLVDCLTLWVTNLLLLEDEAALQQQLAELLRTLPQLPGNIIFVSNEVGLGMVPMGALSRRFQDVTGDLHQQLAPLCDAVTLVAAGLPLVLKAASNSN